MKFEMIKWRLVMRELSMQEVEEVGGGDWMSLDNVATAFTVATGVGVSAGAITGSSYYATVGGIVGVAVVGSFVAGWTVGTALYKLYDCIVH
ncbi:MAG: hypothetical protein RQ899_05130 [Pseudomonadales bacterium]|nr:hypothetical protein [Pseudomonadales bacterium]